MFDNLFWAQEIFFFPGEIILKIQNAFFEKKKKIGFKRSSFEKNQFISFITILHYILCSGMTDEMIFSEEDLLKAIFFHKTHFEFFKWLEGNQKKNLDLRINKPTKLFAVKPAYNSHSTGP